MNIYHFSPLLKEKLETEKILLEETKVLQEKAEEVSYITKTEI